MPTIPQFDNPSAQPGLAPAARIDPAAAAAPAQALAQGGAQVAGAFEAWNQQYVQARRGVQAVNAMAAVSPQLQELQLQKSRQTDHVQARAEYDAASGDIIKSAVAGISDPLVASHVQQALTQENIARGGEVARQSFGMEASKVMGDLDMTTALYVRQAASAPDGSFIRSDMTDRALGAIKQAVAGGWMMPEDGARRELAFRGDLSLADARNAINANPGNAVAMLSDPSNFPALDPARREALIGRADSKATALMMHADAMASRADARAERDFHRQQDQNLTNIFADVADGKPASPGDIADMGRNGQLSASQTHAALLAIAKDDAPVNDPTTTLRLWRGMGDGSTTADDVAHALTNRLLTTATASDLQKAINTADGKEEGGIDKANHATLKTATGLNADNTGMFAKMTMDPAAQVNLQTQAEQEWTQRVRVGHEDSSRVLADMLPRYQFLPPSLAIPNPLAGAIESSADVERVRVNTQRAFQAGQITEDQARQQGVLIQQWAAFRQAQAQRAAIMDQSKPLPPPPPKVQK